MYQPQDGKPVYNQPPSAAATGFPVSANSTTSAAYSGAPTSLYTPPHLVEWSTGLCDCCSNPGNSCLTFCCPCITFGRVAEIVDQGSTSCGLSGTCYALICCVFGCGYLYSCCYRSKMREQYSLKGNGCTDCMVHCCCETCALCQEYRELENRGFNMDIGWHGNVEQRTRGISMATTAPATGSGMNR
ncbi:protein PLANT CADMIUM RESISTANCE [Trifolium repens]|nr:protein PLANT CADMIUM RESISTANCE [Trifolium repens]